MLTHRTNVLFSTQEYKLYTQLAKKQNWTISQMIRDALKQVYQSEDRKDLLRSTQKMWKLLKNPQQKVPYKAWIEAGRTR